MREVEVGYQHMQRKEFVPVDEAYEYALRECLFGSREDKDEFKQMLVEWYFSGNWTKEEREWN